MSKRYRDDEELSRGEITEHEALCYAAYHGGQGYENEFVSPTNMNTFRFHILDPNIAYDRITIVANRNKYIVGRTYKIKTQLVEYRERERAESLRKYKALEIVDEGE